MEYGQKIHIGGIKFSEELAQVTVGCKTTDDCTIHQLLHLLAERDINLTFLCHAGLSGNIESIFCIDRADLGKVQQILIRSSLPNEQVQIIPSIGTLTLFPHRNEMKLLGLVIGLFGKHGFPVHSFSTSISAIAFNTDYSLLDEITERLQDIFVLPENHAPFRQDFRVTQIQL